MGDEKPPRTTTAKDGVPEQTIHDDEGADGLGYTARPTDHEPEGEKAPAKGGRHATGK